METPADRFPDLTAAQLAKYAAMEALYREWNARINVISRKDMDNLATHHILHSLAIAKVIGFPAGSTVLDVGTGGGFPGIPLAVMFPGVQFTLCDSIGKIVRVASAVADALQLDNVTCVNARAESLPGRYDFVVSRAVADLSDFWPWVKDKVVQAVFCLKGGDLEAEIARCASRWRLDSGKFYVAEISRWFSDPYFEEKKIVTISQ